VAGISIFTVVGPSYYFTYLPKATIYETLGDLLGIHLVLPIVNAPV
jgi:hypothetical protein